MGSNVDQLERHAIANELIEFDYKWSRLFSGKPGTVEAAGVTPQDMSEAWGKSIKFTSGTGVVYKDNIFIKTTPQAAQLASNVLIGSHFLNYQVVSVSNAHTTQLQGRVWTDGRWRLIIFPGDVRDQSCFDALQKLGEQLDSPKGPARRYAPVGADVDSVIETLTVFATPHRYIQSIEFTLPTILQPERKPYGVRAFDTLFSDEPSYHDGFGKAYEGYGIDPKVGCVVVTRPDQHTAGVYAMDDFEGICECVCICVLGEVPADAALVSLSKPSLILCRIHASAGCVRWYRGRGSSTHRLARACMFSECCIPYHCIPIISQAGVDSESCPGKLREVARRWQARQPMGTDCHHYTSFFPPIELTMGWDGTMATPASPH